MIGQILGFIFGMFTKGEGSQKAVGVLNGLSLVGAVSGAVLWLIGPGREWTITLNALELAGALFVFSIILEKVRRMDAV